MSISFFNVFVIRRTIHANEIVRRVLRPFSRARATFFFYYRGKMLYADPSALTPAGSDLRPNP